MVSKCTFALAAGILVVAMSGAAAATLNPIQGNVSVNTGAGYQPVTAPVSLQPGDMVMVDPEGSASITNPDGTVVTVEPGQVVTVAENGFASVAAAAGGLTTQTLVIGGLVVGGGIGLGVALSQGGDSKSSDKPASP